MNVFNKQKDTLRVHVMAVHLQRTLSICVTIGLTNNHTYYSRVSPLATYGHFVKDRCTRSGIQHSPHSRCELLRSRNLEDIRGFKVAQLVELIATGLR